MHKEFRDWSRPKRSTDSREMGAGDPSRTPLGHPVVSRHDVLSKRIRADLRAYGSEALFPASAYRLQALYLDFGRTTPREDLVESVLGALDAPCDAAEAAVANPRLLEQVARLSRRALTTVLVFNAHFWDVGLALEVVGGEQPLELAAVGTCAFVAERRTGRSLDGDLRYYAPLRERRQAFCSDHCLPTIGPRPSDDRPCVPPRTPVDCGMLKVLEGFRFFASFPEE